MFIVLTVACSKEVNNNYPPPETPDSSTPSEGRQGVEDGPNNGESVQVSSQLMTVEDE